MEVKKSFWSKYSFAIVLIALSLVACVLIYRDSHSVLQSSGTGSSTSVNSEVFNGDLGGELPPDGGEPPADMNDGQPPSGGPME
jgi:hypothetical protein